MTLVTMVFIWYNLMAKMAREEKMFKTVIMVTKAISMVGKKVIV